MRLVLSTDLAGRVKAYARAKTISVSDAAARLLDIALDHLEARRAGAIAVNAGRTKAERSDAAKKAIGARWAASRELATTAQRAAEQTELPVKSKR